MNVPLPLFIALSSLAGRGVALKVNVTFDFEEWIRNPGYHEGGTPQEQLRCYALPFGGIGFASHVLTYLTFFILAAGRSPILPWRRIDHGGFSLALGIVSLLSTLSISILVGVRCRASWSFILISVWKILLSFSVCVSSIHAAVRTMKVYGAWKDAMEGDEWRRHRVRRRQKGAFKRFWSGYDDVPHGKYSGVLGWLAFVVVGNIIGMAGIGPLVRQSWNDIPKLRTLSYVFIGVSACIMALSFLYGCLVPPRSEDGKISRSMGGVFAFLLSAGAASFLVPFYIDWALAVMVGDLAGLPTSENMILYWSYFVAKRLPMFIS